MEMLFGQIVVRSVDKNVYDGFKNDPKILGRSKVTDSSGKVVFYAVTKCSEEHPSEDTTTCKYCPACYKSVCKRIKK